MPQLGSLLREIAYDPAITVSNSATRLTIGNVRGTSERYAAEKVIIIVEAAQIRWRADGTDPTDSTGHPANVGTILTFDNRDRIEKFRAIRTSADATLSVSYLA